MMVRGLQHLDAIKPEVALASPPCPVLAIAATHDDMIDISDTRLICAASPVVRLAEIAGGHFDPYVDPHFAANLATQTAFLDQVFQQPLTPRELEAAATGA